MELKCSFGPLGSVVCYPDGDTECDREGNEDTQSSGISRDGTARLMIGRYLPLLISEPMQLLTVEWKRLSDALYFPRSPRL
jgi:hypothetical protein